VRGRWELELLGKENLKGFTDTRSQPGRTMERQEERFCHSYKPDALGKSKGHADV